jgi:hypothetical protein
LRTAIGARTPYFDTDSINPTQIIVTNIDDPP